ncbi:cytochrome b5 domain-containing protein [Clostridiaceae bacterium 35-E11]
MSNDITIKAEMQKCLYRISYLNQKMYFTQCPYERLYHSQLLAYEQNKMRYLRGYLSMNRNYPTVVPQQREFTLEELVQYDGTEGKPAYVAVNGIVYDASLAPSWGGGTHFGVYAGKDVTKQFLGCHGNEAILQSLPKVGIIKNV